MSIEQIPNLIQCLDKLEHMFSPATLIAVSVTAFGGGMLLSVLIIHLLASRSR